MLEKEQVCVLLATYNPKEYINNQIESILNQKNVEVEIIIRDDGSKNKEYLNKFKNHPKITILEGDNLGVGRNIMTLVKYAYHNKKNYKYFAYSDQDDFWLENKLEVAIRNIKKLDEKKPALYCSNLKVVDENLNFTHYLFRKGVVKNNFGQSLAQVFCFACTTMFNYEMVKQLQEYDIENMGFDSLIYYRAVVDNNMFYDDESYILYRQHGDNVSGQHEKGVKLIKRRINQIINYKKEERCFEYNANYLLNNMDDVLNSEQKELLQLVINYRKSFWGKIKLLFCSKIRAGYYPKDLYRVFRILVNRY